MILTSIFSKLSKPKGRNITAFKSLLSIIFMTMQVLAFSQNMRTRMVYVLDTENNSVPGIKLKVDFCEKEIEGLTNDKGVFRYDILDEDTCTKATISIRSYLYMPVDTIIDFSSSINPQIILKPIDLYGVEIIGYRPISQENAEKITFKISTKGLLESAKADMALRRIPNIIYADGIFTLIGKQKKAKVLVNGIDVSEQELSKVDAKDIDKVELHQVGLNDDQHSGEIRILLKKDLSSLYKGEIDMGANLLNIRR